MELGVDGAISSLEAIEAPLRDAVAQEGDGDGPSFGKVLLFFLYLFNDFHI